LYMVILFSRDSCDFLFISQFILLTLSSNCLLLAFICVCHDSFWSRWSPRYLTSCLIGMGKLLTLTCRQIALLLVNATSKMSTRSRKIIFLGSRARPVRRADSFTVICQPVWESRRFTRLWSFTTCHGGGITMIFKRENRESHSLCCSKEGNLAGSQSLSIIQQTSTLVAELSRSSQKCFICHSEPACFNFIRLCNFTFRLVLDRYKNAFNETSFFLIVAGNSFRQVINEIVWCPTVLWNNFQNT
jgi:hypothetical protein